MGVGNVIGVECHVSQNLMDWGKGRGRGIDRYGMERRIRWVL